ncbi:BMC domain-containing protein [Gracilibacillus salitolerans]|uniref:BMC domain-containing protein n=1 Tax=Gracilibacillus salitolerans TaxID=2663022 RepID=A0A5Q2TMU8_9BACI|nr:BMC domain-containing protein [Gracilibacillus salitolerans]QGH35407.1 BMC domain-containing protein [Gracilibacillus salitolerans]
MKRSLGLIEVIGTVTAMIAIDAMSKHAFVEVIKVEEAGSGLLTIMIEGDLASVQAALEVGATQASHHGEVVTMKSIPKPDDKMYGKLIPDKEGDSA